MRTAVLALYRVRGIIFYATGLALILATVIAVFDIGSVSQPAQWTLAIGIFSAGLLGLLLTFFGHRALRPRDVEAVASPVRGRWLGLNSPTSKTPSHGVRMYGQTYAIDLVAEPHAKTRPVFGVGAWMRDSKDYPAFNEPVYAMVDGVVVRARDGKRDHRARSGWVALFYLMFEGMVREVGGPGFIVGNHVTIRREDGVYALVAHLQKGSAQVKIGDTVRVGQQVASCGNSGNSSEPHVHAQLMDRKSLWTAQGIPMAFEDVDLVPKPLPGEGDEAEQEVRPRVTGLPLNNQHILVGE